MTQEEVAAYVRAHAPAYGLDASAVLAVAQAEGWGGGIGDGGTSFGPWQLHAGGALPAGQANMIQTLGPGPVNDWAWSQNGIDTALQSMQTAGSGLTGAEAVRGLVTHFERPSDIPGEITRALGFLGLAVPGGSGPVSIDGTGTSTGTPSGAGGGPGSAENPTQGASPACAKPTSSNPLTDGAAWLSYLGCVVRYWGLRLGLAVTAGALVIVGIVIYATDKTAPGAQGLKAATRKAGTGAIAVAAPEAAVARKAEKPETMSRSKVIKTRQAAGKETYDPRANNHAGGWI